MKYLLLLLLACSLHAAQTRFVCFGDSGDNDQQEKDVADLVKSLKPDFIVMLGDTVYGSDTNFAWFDKAIGQYYWPYIWNYHGKYKPWLSSRASNTNAYLVMGNHDRGSGDTASTVNDRYQTALHYFGLSQSYYQFRRGPVDGFAIDAGFGTDQNIQQTNGVTENSVQGLYMSNRMALSTNYWKLAFMHQPAYTSFATTAQHTNLSNDGRLQYPKMRWSFFSNYVQIVFNGHVHGWEKIYTNGVYYITEGRGGRDLASTRGWLPLAGSQKRYTNDFGATLVTATESNLTVSAYTRRGTLIDQLVLTR